MLNQSPSHPTPEQSAEMARLNDRARRGLDACRVIDSAGFAALPLVDRREIAARVARFDDWDSASNPYDEHDFGVVYLRRSGGWTTARPEPGSWDYAVFWKFDYRDSKGREPAPTRGTGRRPCASSPSSFLRNMDHGHEWAEDINI